MKKKLIKKIAVTGALSALSILLGVTKLGFIPFAGAAITILHVPVIIGAILEGPVAGLIIGLIFGVWSMIQAAISPTGVLDPFFVNPLVSVVPRACIGLVAWAVFYLLRKIKILPKIIPAAVAAFFGSLTNTVLVIGSLFLLFKEQITQIFENKGFVVVIASLMPQALIEAAAAVIITVAVVGCISGYTNSRKKSRLSEADQD